MKKLILSGFCLVFAVSVQAQNFVWYSSNDTDRWQQKNVRPENKATKNPDVLVSYEESPLVFKAWGATFNELDWDALNMLSKETQEEIIKNIFAPNGDLKFTSGRISMNANDYSRDWYSCSEVPGDFQLKYFNIDRDKTSLIPFIKFAQKYNPGMSFWVSPWSPPAWMKVNQHYAVRSHEKYNDMSPLSDVLHENKGPRDNRFFPRELVLEDYFIQDPRYLTAYANSFCKFISAYKEEGIDISMVMYQNEAWSYTVYPGCAWTPEGIIRFNAEYLAPALKKQHPEVKLYLGTINTNRFDIIDQVLSDPLLAKSIEGVGFQWEGGQILPRIREKYPQYKYVQTESECGNGSFNWGAGEHTFHLVNHYLGNGCEEYTIWNVILANNGVSPWGWKQNALIRVDAEAKTATYTPEYYAVKHYSNFVTPGSKLVSWKESGADKKPVLVYITPQGKYVVIAGNFHEQPQPLSVKVGKKYLNVTLEPHSFNTFTTK